MFDETIKYLKVLGFSYIWLESKLKTDETIKTAKLELKRVYRMKSKEVHPDVTKKDGTEFEKLLEAYNFILQILEKKIDLPVKEIPQYRHGRNIFEVVGRE